MHEPTRTDVDTIVLDVDGTLVDTVYHHVRAWDDAFAAVDVDVPSWRVHRAIGMAGDRLVTEVAGEAVEREHGDRVRAEHDASFEQMLARVRALPGARDLLVELRRRGLNVVIATSGRPEDAERLLELVDGNDLAHEQSTSADAEESKPAPDIVDASVEKAGGDTAIVVGDAVWDIQAAAARGRASIGVLTGGISEAELRSAGATFVYGDTADLLAHLDDIISPVTDA